MRCAMMATYSLGRANVAKADQWVDRIGAGPCEWRYEGACWNEVLNLKRERAAMGAMARIEDLVERARLGTVCEVEDPPLPVYRYPLAGATLIGIGELRAFRRKHGKKLHVRLYYTQPDFSDDVVLGAKLGEKPDSKDDDEWDVIQNEHMGEAAMRHLMWVALPDDERVCASTV